MDPPLKRAYFVQLLNANFEKFMFMKGNQHHVAAMLAEQDAKAAKLEYCS
jgi:hypothetical protein